MWILIGKARMLCAHGGRNNTDVRAAVFSYNHADWYVSQVVTQAAHYYETTPNSSVACPTFQSTVQYGGQDARSCRVRRVSGCSPPNA